MTSRLLAVVLALLSLSRAAVAQVSIGTLQPTSPPTARATLLAPTNRDPFDYSKDAPPECKPQVVIAPPVNSPINAGKTAEQHKAEEAEAAKRVATIHHLGTVPSHQYPEMESALTSGLRADPCEAVRFEAAKVLSKGSCCSSRTVSALIIAVNGGNSDGNPTETSDRVKTMAARALQIFATRSATKPTQPPNGSLPANSKQGESGVQAAAYANQQSSESVPQEQFDRASRVLAETISTTPTTRAQATAIKAFNNATRGLTNSRPANSDSQAPLPLARIEFQPTRPVALTAPPAILQENR